jgi:hypothetical protein
MTWTRRVTAVLIVVTVAALIAWDVFVFVEPTEGDTISEVVLAWAWKSAFVPFALGVLGGHFTWPRPASSAFRKWSAVGLLVFGLALLSADVLGWTPDVMPVIYFVPGIVAGHVFWPQQQMEA